MDKKSLLLDKWEPKDLKRASKLKQQNPSWRIGVLQDCYSSRQIPTMPQNPQIEPLGPQILFLSKAKDWWFHITHRRSEAWNTLRLSDVWCFWPARPSQQKLWQKDLQKEARVHIILINHIYLLRQNVKGIKNWDYSSQIICLASFRGFRDRDRSRTENMTAIWPFLLGLHEQRLLWMT